MFIGFICMWQSLPEVLLPEMVNIKEALLMPALAAGNESIISGLVCLMAELGQAVSTSEPT
jgi:transportin-3